MRSYQLLLTAVSAIAISSSAFAADLPTHKSPAPPPVYAPAFSWTGAYIGGFVGGNWSKSSLTDVTNPAAIISPALNGNGLTAGGLAGYNFAFNNFVIGAEMEAGYDHRGAGGDFFTATRHFETSGEAEGRLRGRIGWAWNKFLLFGAAGGTAADLKLSATSLVNNSLPAGFTQEMTHWRSGFNVGGGVEWAFADHWTIRGEYIYDNFGSTLYDTHFPNASSFDSKTVKLQESTARAVLSYKF